MERYYKGKLNPVLETPSVANPSTKSSLSKIQKKKNDISSKQSCVQLNSEQYPTNPGKRPPIFKLSS
jgi:hypothetical protein